MPRVRLRVTFATAACVLALFLTVSVASGNESGGHAVANVPREEELQAPPHDGQDVDSFTLAFIGMSLGCMCVASSVHWTLSQRKRLEANIQSLDRFLAENCAVAFRLHGSGENDPMFRVVKDMQANHEAHLYGYTDQYDEMVKKISGIEAVVMRILG